MTWNAVCPDLQQICLAVGGAEACLKPLNSPPSVAAIWCLWVEPPNWFRESDVYPGLDDIDRRLWFIYRRSSSALPHSTSLSLTPCFGTLKTDDRTLLKSTFMPCCIIYVVSGGSSPLNKRRRRRSRDAAGTKREDSQDGSANMVAGRGRVRMDGEVVCVPRKRRFFWVRPKTRRVVPAAIRSSVLRTDVVLDSSDSPRVVGAALAYEEAVRLNVRRHVQQTTQDDESAHQTTSRNDSCSFVQLMEEICTLMSRLSLDEDNKNANNASMEAVGDECCPPTPLIFDKEASILRAINITLPGVSSGIEKECARLRAIATDVFEPSRVTVTLVPTQSCTGTKPVCIDTSVWSTRQVRPIPCYVDCLVPRYRLVHVPIIVSTWAPAVRGL
ncbi:hypothetical protein NM688_g4357 [Phlebia brevispora]|uniref:Uncharacterized protein n=1 Tax=Phlebia brevispora TaxID=194682 RepID=A0ACC1T3S0_9APHY|nr:hypothetical protein NM688_g4357 [Phlebia brevispora]